MKQYQFWFALVSNVVAILWLMYVLHVQTSKPSLLESGYYAVHGSIPDLKSNELFLLVTHLLLGTLASADRR